MAVSLTSTALSACGSGGGGSDSGASNISSVSSEGGAWAQFAAQLSGSVVRPGQNDYESLHRVYNARFDHNDDYGFDARGN